MHTHTHTHPLPPKTNTHTHTKTKRKNAVRPSGALSKLTSVHSRTSIPHCHCTVGESIVANYIARSIPQDSCVRQLTENPTRAFAHTQKTHTYNLNTTTSCSASCRRIAVRVPEWVRGVWGVRGGRRRGVGYLITFRVYRRNGQPTLDVCAGASAHCVCSRTCKVFLLGVMNLHPASKRACVRACVRTGTGTSGTGSKRGRGEISK